MNEIESIISSIEHQTLFAICMQVVACTVCLFSTTYQFAINIFNVIAFLSLTGTKQQVLLLFIIVLSCHFMIFTKTLNVKIHAYQSVRIEHVLNLMYDVVLLYDT